MKIEGFNEFLNNSIQTQKNKGAGGPDIGSTFSDFLKEVNTDQIESKKSVEDFVTGNGVELHDVMLAGEKAKTSLDLLMQIRNKAVDMFKELTRIPV
jgi:flagellar hook-basal body complex protein FliE